MPLALFALAALSALIVERMTRLGVLDIPGTRSSHDRPTPKGGGVGIAAAFLAGLGLAALDGLLPHEQRRTASLLCASLLLAAVSWADDVRQRGLTGKFAAQIAAALILILNGWTIDRLGPFALGQAAGPITLVWLVAATNAVNFIDGLNGLAAGSVLIASITAAVASRAGGDPLPSAALLPLAAGLAGFLPFNYPRARIFMGDVGSQLCGLVLAASAAPLSDLPNRSWGVVLVPMAMAPILADVAFTLARRALAGERLTQAHRGHLYQLATRAGQPAPLVTLAFWSLTLATSLFGLYASRGPWPRMIVFVLAGLLPLALAGLLTVRAARRSPLGQW